MGASFRPMRKSRMQADVGLTRDFVILSPPTPPPPPRLHSPFPTNFARVFCVSRVPCPKGVTSSRPTSPE